MKSLALMFSVVWALWGCSQGGFQNSRDYFQSLYGLSPMPLSLSGRSFIGRVVDEEGHAVPMARIYLKGVPLYTTSNQKGGFLLSGLQDAHSTIYIIGGNGLGKTLNIELDEAHLIENEQIVLEKNVRVSGRVMSGAAPVSDARISMEGSPFTTNSDGEGQFVLELPTGDYRLEVQHLLYNPFELEQLPVAGDIVRNMDLEPLGFPTVELRLDKAEGSLIRGLSTTIQIDKSPSVRYMRVISHSFNISSELPSTWVEARDALALTHKGPGLSWLSLQFMDQFGKMTDPMNVSYYNTLYDTSWRLILGTVTEPLHIRKNEKVAFIGSVPPPHGATNSKPSIPGSPVVTASADVGSGSSSIFSTVINAPVDVEGGAILRGGAQFNHSLRLQGTEDHPVAWDLRGEAGESGTAWIRSSQGVMRHAQLQGGHLAFEPSFRSEIKDGLWQVEHSSFDRMQIAFSNGYTLDSMRIGFEFCFFGTSQLSFHSWGKSAETGDAVPTPELPAGFLQDLSIALVSNTFQDSRLQNDGPDSADSEEQLAMVLEKNNFFGQVQPDYYLRLPKGILAHDAQVTLTAGENYFEFSEAIIANFPAWSPYLGKVLDQPLP
ncbi:carboxypeptidase-like regulatory domain-containing protein [Oligoflexus tunisiensis]|uniref:carboxypeptidase-like regulatory domain-containing protein n=1 Tax=Oligoflexus tunisiensis TaxID=708132 RepID=UPI00114D2D3C|nr:carboxypeptidase regulatory-like domain-containing protein [Oligoflexus tunisiensis]